MREGPTITALIIARDEAANLPACLDALDWVDERVIVVDAACQDETEAIAKRRAEVVIVRTFDTFARQRNAGLARVGGDWVFSIDADERSSPEQAAEIRRRILTAPESIAAFRVPIVSEILGRPFRFSGTQLDRPVRLFRPKRGRWTGHVHETVELDGEVDRSPIGVPLRHQSLPDLSTFLRKLDVYTTLEAAKRIDAGTRLKPGDLALRPAWTFLKLYLYRQGFRDGFEGFAYCLLSGLSVFVRNAKHRALLKDCPALSEERSACPSSGGLLS
jgi:glycosyltransferase involved in cell wall biosynthesis